MQTLQLLPKAEIHVHVEGTLTPAMARSIAARNKVTLDSTLFTADGNEYAYKNFLDLVTHVYQAMARVMHTREDYAQITHDYLIRCAAQNTLYVELIACAGQCQLSGISYRDMIDGIADGIDRAQAETGIIARLNITFERHRPEAEAEKDADLILSYPHPYIVGLDLAGGEIEGDIPQFRPVFDRVQKDFGRPLGIRMHAGEGAGTVNLRDALDCNVTRIGHGVRIIEDAGLMREVCSRGIALEVCPTSNLYLVSAYKHDFKNHPLRRLYDAGIKITLNSDDPGMFGQHCSIGGEYEIARDKFGFTESELYGITRTALEAAYLDNTVRTDLLKKL